MSTALERRFPELTGVFPRAELTNLPTPVRRFARFGDAFGRDDLWIKCDDATARPYGGNKPRKLEYILGDALAKGRKSVLTTGGTGTHHGLATAIYARQVGLECHLVLLDQPVTDDVRRSLLMDHAAGAKIHFAKSVPQVAARATRVLATEALKGSRPYIIRTGGSSPIGTIGYVDAALEFAEQVEAGEVPEPAVIYVPTGSAGTLAGLLLGFAMAGLRSRFEGVVVSDILPPTKKQLGWLCAGTLRKLQRAGLPPSLRRRGLGHARQSLGEGVGGLERDSLRNLDLDHLTLRDSYVGPGYGAATAEAQGAMDRLLATENVQLEMTYTGKCLAALVDDLGAGSASAGPTLFWNTYSSVDPAAHLGPLPDFRALPEEFHHLWGTD